MSQQPPDRQQPFEQPQWGQQVPPHYPQPQQPQNGWPTPNSLPPQHPLQWTSQQPGAQAQPPLYPPSNNPQPEEQQQNSMAYAPLQSGIDTSDGERTMRRNKQRVVIFLLLVGLVLLASVGTWTYLAIRSQNTQTSQWVLLPQGATPTIPADGYLFKNATGGFSVYHVSATPSTTITWTTYHNQQDGYTIDYPSNWVRVETSSDGHMGLAFYPPGTNLNENIPGGPKGIGFRWVKTYQPAVSTDSTIANIKPVTIDGVTGQLYTQGSLGATITVTFPLKGKGFIMTADASSDVLMYVFQHMLESLKFI